MLVKANRQIILLTTVAALIATSGCGESGRQSHFVPGDQTQTLMREAQNGIGEVSGVRDLVDARFGDPQNLKAWTKLPIDFGGAKGSVAESPDASIAVKDLTLKLEGDLEVQEGEPVLMQFMTGEAAPAVVMIDSWTPESGRAALSAALEVTPKAGDLVVINGGGNLAHGRGLYMRHCSHCHGTSGDGNGPTAKYLNPLPRDYRQGKFKFTSTKEMSKASRDDLTRVLRHGIPGTYMPSFVPMLDEKELYSVVEYIRFLAMRGEFERGVANELKSDYSSEALASRVSGGEKRSEILTELKEFLEGDLVDGLEFVEQELVEKWSEADSGDAVVIPSVARVEDTVHSRRIGRQLFLSAALKCSNCHGIGGQGNGPQTRDYELDANNQPRPEPGLYNDWGHVVQPRNLTTGIYRGGRRPVDIFRRIYAGIKGAKMPAFGGKSTSDEDIWHLVNYVLSVPFEADPGVPAGDAAEATASTASL